MSNISQNEKSPEQFKQILEYVMQHVNEITDFNLIYITKDGNTYRTGMNLSTEGLLKTVGLLSTVVTQLGIELISARNDLLQKPEGVVN